MSERDQLERALLDAEAKYRELVRQIEIQRIRRNNAIRDALHNGGIKRAEIARLIGLGRARVGQIAKTPREPEP